MEREKEKKVNLMDLPPLDDTEGWEALGKEAREFEKQHMQDGREIYPTFGGNLAIGGLRKYIDKIRRVNRLKELNAPDIITENELKQAVKAKKSALDLDHEKVAYIRKSLANLKPKEKRIQNEIFTKMMLVSGGKSPFILDTLNPTVDSVKNTATRFLNSLLEKKEKNDTYNFIDKLTGEDEDGNPLVSDETFKNFFEWYQASLAKAQNELNKTVPDIVEDYTCEFNLAIEKGLLPNSFKDNLEFLEPNSNSPRARNLHFSLFDMSTDDTLGACANKQGDDPEQPVALRADHVDNSNVLFHELTHCIAGDEIRFDGCIEAERIMREALTENISYIVNGVKENAAFMSGKAYEIERNVVKYLSIGGQKEIPPELFYNAYAEYDPDYTDEIMFDGTIAEPKVGEAKQALYDALFESFPKCKNLRDLGELIEEKFNNFDDVIEEILNK